MGLGSIFKKLKTKKTNEEYPATLHLNARIMPMFRSDLEDSIDNLLQKNSLGFVLPGGSKLSEDREINGCDINLIIYSIDVENIKNIIDLIYPFGVPKGSKFSVGGQDISIGYLEGMAIYINGSDLSDEVYKNNDINEVIEKFNALLEDKGGLFGHQRLEKYTGLYYYGNSYEEMKSCIKNVIEKYSICEKCKIERIS